MKFLDSIQKLSAKQIIVIVALVLLVVFAVPLIIAFYRRRLEKAQERKTEKAQQVNTDAVTHAQEEILEEQLSYSHSEYVQMSSKLVTAFSGWGTGLTAVLEVFSRLKNKSDFFKLVETYGIREYYSESVFWFTFKGDLYQTLAYELDDSERSEVNDLLSAIGISI